MCVNVQINSLFLHASLTTQFDVRIKIRIKREKFKKSFKMKSTANNRKQDAKEEKYLKKEPEMILFKLLIINNYFCSQYSNGYFVAPN